MDKKRMTEKYIYLFSNAILIMELIYVSIMYHQSICIFSFEKQILSMAAVGLGVLIFLSYFKRHPSEKWTVSVFFFITICAIYGLKQNQFSLYMKDSGFDGICKGIMLIYSIWVIVNSLLYWKSMKVEGQFSLLKTGKTLLVCLLIACLIVTVTSNWFDPAYNAETSAKHYGAEKRIASDGERLLYIDNHEIKHQGLTGELEKEVEKWSSIMEVDINEEACFGLSTSGRVYVAEGEYDKYKEAEKWTGIVDISAGITYLIGLTRDGALLITGEFPTELKGITAIEEKVSYIDANFENAVAVTEKGRVEVFSPHMYYFDEAESWNDIEYVSIGVKHILGLTNDGKLLATGPGMSGECDMSGLTKITYAYAGLSGTTFITTKGNLLTVGDTTESIQINPNYPIAVCEMDEILIYDNGSINRYKSYNSGGYGG